MRFDLYMSEMSVSDFHGGGLTLQRILAGDLRNISTFVYLDRFATDFAANDAFANKGLDLRPWHQRDSVRGIIGCRPADWLGKRRASRLLHARVAARVIMKHFSNQPTIRALICPQGVASLLTSSELFRQRRLEYVTWVMDDQFLRYLDGQWRYPDGIEALFARHLKQASQVFVISPAMGEFYRARFGVESTVLFGPAVPQENLESRTCAGGLVRLGYFGTLHEWQLGALSFFCECLEAASATLDIYTGATSLPPQLQRPGVRLKARVASGEVGKTMSGYDGLVLPVSFSPEWRHLSQMNIATKMSECIGSGVPTLLIGPPYAAMVRFLRPSGAAIIVTEQSVADVVAGVARLRDPSTRDKLLVAARNLTHSELSLSTMRELWQRATRRDESFTCGNLAGSAN